MVRCETDKEYENLWTEYNKNLLNEPFLPAKMVVKSDIKYGISPELFRVIEKKEDEMEKMMKEGEQEMKEGEQEKKEGEQEKKEGEQEEKKDSNEAEKKQE